MTFPLLSILILAPVLAGLVLVCSNTFSRTGRGVALATTGFTFFLSLIAAVKFAPAAGFQFVERYNWLPQIGLEYHLALDGISLVFVLLTGVVVLMSLLATGAGRMEGTYYGLVLLLEAGLIGTFTAQNFLHFFLFWELSLIPAFFLVKNYGGAQRSFAAIQFFVYTMVGSIAMLLAFLAIYLATGSFDFAELSRLNGSEGFAASLAEKLNWPGITAGRAAAIVFVLAFAGVAVKVPIWPFHSWLPAAYTEAPTPVTMILTGVMSKMGVYGLLRLILPLFPREIDLLHRPLLALAVITILYGALAALAQRDIKRFFAYSSLSHLGYCFLGIFAAAKAGDAVFVNDRAAAVNGVILQVLSHGVIAAALFAFVHFLERRNNGLRSIELFGGLRKVNPQFAAIMGIAIFASLGLPGLSGFPAEFLIFKGAFTFAPVAASFAVLGLLLTALYLLTFFGKVFLGPLNERQANSADLTLAEKGVVLPAIGLAFLLGIVPQLLVFLFNPSVTGIVRQLRF